MKKKINQIGILLSISILSFYSCSNSNSNKNIKFAKENHDTIGLRKYFNDSIAYTGYYLTKYEIDNYLKKWKNVNEYDTLYKKKIELTLYAFKEKPLFNFKNNDKIEIYRFLWIRSFHAPICITIKKDNNKITYIGKITDGIGGQFTGLIKQSINKLLSENSWNKFIKTINQSMFWDMNERNKKEVFDGSIWLIEGFKNGNYHYVIRWSPEENKDNKTKYYKEIGLFLIKQLNLKIAKIY